MKEARFEQQVEPLKESQGAAKKDLEYLSEKEKEIESIEEMPELTIDRILIDNLLPKKEEGMDLYEYKKHKIDIEKILSIIRSQEDAFEKLNQRDRELAEKTSLPEDQKVVAASEEIFKETPNILKELGVLPRDFEEKNATLPPIKIEYDSDMNYSRYIDHSIANPPEDGEKKSYIQIGGFLLKRTATEILDKATEVGIKMSIADSIHIGLVYNIGHEYGHGIKYKYQPSDYTKASPFFERSKRIAGCPLPFDNPLDEEGLFSERFAQSIADQLTAQALKSKGYNEEEGYAIRKLVCRQEDNRLARYKELIDKGKEQGYSPSEISDFLLDIRIRLEDNGCEEEAEKIKYNFSSGGYYAPVFDKEQLQYIMDVEEQ